LTPAEVKHSAQKLSDPYRFVGRFHERGQGSKENVRNEAKNRAARSDPVFMASLPARPVRNPHGLLIHSSGSARKSGRPIVSSARLEFSLGEKALARLRSCKERLKARQTSRRRNGHREKPSIAEMSREYDEAREWRAALQLGPVAGDNREGRRVSWRRPWNYGGRTTLAPAEAGRKINPRSEHFTAHEQRRTIT